MPWNFFSFFFFFLNQSPLQICCLVRFIKAQQIASSSKQSIQIRFDSTEFIESKSISLTRSFILSFALPIHIFISIPFGIVFTEIRHRLMAENNLCINFFPENILFIKQN